ncbi:unnamed protein product [Effrenium voratum]|nr:unnamed protein product [Effrenium voratum]
MVPVKSLVAEMRSNSQLGSIPVQSHARNGEHRSSSGGAVDTSAFEARIHDLEEQCEEAEAKLTTCMQQLESSTAELEMAQHEVASERMAHAASQEKVAQLEELSAQLQDQNLGFIKTFEEQLETSRRDIKQEMSEQYQAVLDAQAKKVHEAEGNAKRLEGQLRVTLDKIKDLEAALRQERSNARRSEAALAGEHAKIEEMTAKIQSQAARLRQLEYYANSWERKVHELAEANAIKVLTEPNNVHTFRVSNFSRLRLWPKGRMVQSPEFKISQLGDTQIEFFPAGEVNSRPGWCSLRLRIPDGTRLRWRVKIGSRDFDVRDDHYDSRQWWNRYGIQCLNLCQAEELLPEVLPESDSVLIGMEVLEVISKPVILNAFAADEMLEVPRRPGTAPQRQVESPQLPPQAPPQVTVPSAPLVKRPTHLQRGRLQPLRQLLPSPAPRKFVAPTAGSGAVTNGFSDLDLGSRSSITGSAALATFLSLGCFAVLRQRYDHLSQAYHADSAYHNSIKSAYQRLDPARCEDKGLEKQDEADAVNLDTTTLIALTSNLSHGQVGWRFADPELERQATQEAQEPVLKQLEQRLAGRKLCVSRRALSTYQQIVQRMAGPEERARASRVVAALTILEADPVRGISTSKTLTPPMLEVIAVGLEKNMPTSMSNAKVIRALDGKALMLPPHMPRALTEGKQADPASRQHLLQGDELEKMFDNIVGDAEVSAGVGLTAQVKRFWSNADLMRKQTGAERRESKRRKLAQDEQTCAPESGEEPGTCSRPDTASLDLAAGQILADAAFSESRDTTKKRKRPAKGARRRKLAKEQLTCSPEPDEPGTCSPEPDEPGTCSRPDTASLDLAVGQILADAAFSETCSECLAALRKECTAALSGPEFEMKPFDWSPEPTLVAFGSFAQGTALKTSDLDVHLSFQQFAVRRKERQVQYLRAIESSLSGAFQVCSLIDTARVPVLRLSYKELPVDLTMGDAEDCGSVDDAISSILAAGPRARQLVCLVKAFAKANGLVDAYNGYLNSVSWVFLCISFLQAEGCLPAFQETPTDLHAVHLNVETLSRALGFIAKCCSRRHRISLCRSTLGLRPHRGRERLFLEHPKLPARNLAYSLRAPAPKQIARACAAAQLRLRAHGPNEIFCIETKMAEEVSSDSGPLAVGPVRKRPNTATQRVGRFTSPSSALRFEAFCA